jgi:hypothetical protein
MRKDVSAEPTAANTSGGAPVAPWRKDAIVVFIAALAVRLAVVAWAASRIPPVADGTYYHVLATRIAAGLGYTWQWPDGVTTYAAHYPVGYPAAVAIMYRLFGPRPVAAMVLNAFVGALGAAAVHRLAARATSRRGAAIGGLLVAVHPGLVAYTPALMSEGVAAALVACAAWAAARARDAFEREGSGWASVAIVGGVVGLATLVRPQVLVLAPILAAIAAAGARRRRRWRPIVAAALLAFATAVATCLPWTLRNCAKMNRCALVSVNVGWNLLIGADPASTGAWSPIVVPESCREVFDEAAKDACFEREARQVIARHPLEWLALVPRKLAATFDYCGAPGWYLHESNAAAFPYGAKAALGVAETVFERAVLLLSLWWAAGCSHRRTARGARALTPAAIVAAIGALFAVLVHGWVAYIALVAAALLRGRAIVRGPVLGASTIAVVGATVLIHAVFFGAGRYSLLAFPLLSGAAGIAAGQVRKASFDKGAWSRHPSKPEETPKCL